MKIKILKTIIFICKKIDINPKKGVRYQRVKIIKIDLNNTLSLKTAMIENECNTKLYKDIFDGPKYLTPLIESMFSKFLMYFFIVPE